MLAHNWDSLWARLEPALQSVRTVVLERHPGLSGYVKRVAYGNVAFAAQLYFMRDPVRDEHELVLLEIEIETVSNVEVGLTPTGRGSDPDHLAFVVLEIWIPDEGSITRTERSIPRGGTEADISRITSAFVDEFLEALPAHTAAILQTLEERPVPY